MLDSTDKAILNLLQQDASLSVADIAETINLTVSPCWRRIQNLENRGYIEKRVALLNRQQLDLGIDVFVFIKTNQHNDEWIEQFYSALEVLPEVLEAYRMSGDVDYLLRVVVKDISAYDAFYKNLVSKVPLADVSSSFAMERIKFTTAVPI
ncbi:Lrp/AsnC family transcriptional regulator [Reinekea marina]|uniref:Lrp/AsnC family transcriptional regulator n=1 Tax=Reinekea marina TaxID=1310421 RepID=A0ABV7WUS6_9GAMM|nr:Lrp/AsnC family transcriptional regulator [Reinekea marina]MBU2862281.1 Lrp/AsnC family transcriptional regulator [Reinekea forsetii]MDN3649833.1 Lrp/AsnC family transcriptional regulator [Reinekea marina]